VSISAANQLLAATRTQAGTFEGMPYVQYDGISKLRLPQERSACRTGSRLRDPAVGNGTVVVEPSHFAVGLGVLNLYLRRSAGRGVASRL